HVSSYYRHAAPLHLHPFPTRRSSDLVRLAVAAAHHAVAEGDADPGAGPGHLRHRVLPLPLEAATGDEKVATAEAKRPRRPAPVRDRKSTRLNSSHGSISYAVFCLKKK